MGLALLAGALSLSVAARAELPNPSLLARTSPSGNYLAARLAGGQRDMAAAAAYYRAALRADPKNGELIERTFLVVLASGVVDDAVPLAERVVGIDKSHRIARLALAARAINRGQATARPAPPPPPPPPPAPSRAPKPPPPAPSSPNPCAGRSPPSPRRCSPPGPT